MNFVGFAIVFLGILLIFAAITGRYAGFITALKKELGL